MLDLPKLLLLALLLCLMHRLSYYSALFAPLRSLSSPALLLLLHFCTQLGLNYLQFCILRGLYKRELDVRQSTLDGEIGQLLVFVSQLG